MSDNLTIVIRVYWGRWQLGVQLSVSLLLLPFHYMLLVFLPQEFIVDLMTLPPDVVEDFFYTFVVPIIVFSVVVM